MRRRVLLSVVLLGVSASASAHPSAPSPARWEACNSAELGDACRYEDTHHIYRGTCRRIGDALACVRNQPLEHRDR